MAISDTSKVDLLWKKVVFGVSKTDSAAAKSGSNETLASPLPVYANQIWAQAADIPGTPPGTTTSIVQVRTGANRVQGVMDATSTLNLTWKSNLTDWIPATFGANYTVKIYVGDPQTTGTQIFPDTTNEEFVFDYQSGSMTFLNNIPSGVSVNGIYFVGYRYNGTKGITGAGAGARSYVVADITARNALVGLSAGDLVFVQDASGIPTDAGDGEYALYMWDGAQFNVLSTQDGSAADAKTTKLVVTPASSGIISFSRAGNGARIISCSVDVATGFDGTFDATVGIPADHSSIMSINDHDMTSVGSYVVTPTAQMDPTQETQLYVYISGTATVGSATFTITYA